MSGAESVSNYYRGFPSPTSSYSAADGTRPSYGHGEPQIAVSGPPGLFYSRGALTRNGTAMGDGVAGDIGTVVEAELHSSGEEEDVSVCSLDDTSSPTDNSIPDSAVLATPLVS